MKYLTEDRETHIWYIPSQNITCVESTNPRDITKIKRSGWEITDEEVEVGSRGEYTTRIAARVEGRYFTVRNKR